MEPLQVRPCGNFSPANLTEADPHDIDSPGTSVIISPAGEKVDPIVKEQGKRVTANTTYNTGSVVSKTPGSLKVSFDERLKDENLAQFCRQVSLLWTSDLRS